MKKNERIAYAKKEYERWQSHIDDEELLREMAEMEDDEDELIDAFSSELRFGTSGLRGILGPGPGRINNYVIRRATRGLAVYLRRSCEDPSVVIAYDSRRNSRLFAEETAAVLQEYGIRTFLFSDLAPVPLLSFSVRHLGASMGIMITASHNPRIYNGYKVYNRNGYQIVGEEADAILNEMERLDYFTETAEGKGNISSVGEALSQAFLDKILELSTTQTAPELCRSLSVVYSPLNGTGNR